MSSRRTHPLLVVFALLATPAAASACPDCATARAARALVFDEDFGRNLLTAFAPFLVVGLVTATAYRSGSRRAPTNPTGDAS